MEDLTGSFFMSIYVRRNGRSDKHTDDLKTWVVWKTISVLLPLCGTANAGARSFSDMQPLKKTKEGPSTPKPVSQQAPKQSPRDVVPVRRPSPVLSEEEDPWFGITLNGCLLVAVVILVISSSIQCVNEALEPLWWEEDEAGLLNGNRDITADSTEEQHESSMWNSLFWWNRASEDNDDDAEEEERPRKRHAKEKGPSQGEFVRVRHRDRPQKGRTFENEDDEIREKRRKDKRGGRLGEKEGEGARGKRDRRREE